MSKSRTRLDLSKKFDNLHLLAKFEPTRAPERTAGDATGNGPNASCGMYDIAIIGGGVNGCGIARDAAGRGLKVFLAEKRDLASGTSSASTKLIHGGLRYLEHYEFRLVRESLKEREVLLRMAPHIVQPLRFVLPHHRALRPALLIRLGLFLYDHLGGREILPASRAIDLTRAPAGRPLKPGYSRGFEYSDCWVDDARLVVLNAMDAARRGAAIRVRTEVASARRNGDHWLVECEDARTGARETITARALVNAAGPWISEVMAHRVGANARSPLRLVKGSHIVVAKLFDHASAYIFQNADGRIVFAIPYERDFTLIGTTDVDFAGDVDQVEPSADEVNYLCRAASEYFIQPIEASDVVWSYAGVRPLYDDGDASAHEVTRDFVLEREGREGEPPLLNIIGGKITTFRHLAEEALKKLAPSFPEMRAPWTRGSSLPGGDFSYDGRGRLAGDLAAAFPFLGAATAQRLAATYGTMAEDILAGATSASDLGMAFGYGLYEREVEHLIRHEWAVSADDILWRRTKLGLHMSETERSRLSEWLAARETAAASSAA
jgi:glycerol-3-phosphate dehydrogenase